MPKASSKYLEIGASGTEKYNGVITEDYNPKLTFPQNLDIFDQMRKGDATVKASLLVCKLPIMSATYSFIAASEDKKDIEAAEFCEEQFFHRLIWRDFLRNGLLCLDYGFSLFEKVYEIVGNRTYYKKLAPRLPKSLYKWQMDNGEEGITQRAYKNGKYETVSIPREKLFHLSFDQEGGNLEGVSVLRSSYKHWYMKENMYKIQAIGAERTGVGLPVAKLKEGKKLTDEELNKIIQSLENIRTNEEAYIIEMDGVEFRFESSPGTEFKFEEAIMHHDRQIMKAVLAQFLELGVTKGAMSLSEDHSSLFYVALKSTADLIVEKVQRELVREIVDLNFDGITKYPQLIVSDIGSVDHNALSTSLQRLVQTGLLTPDTKTEEHLRKLLSLPEISEEERNEIKEKKQKKEAPKEEPKEEEKKEPLKNSVHLDASGKYFRKLTLAEEKVDFEKIRQILDGGESRFKKILEKHSKDIQKDFEEGMKKYLETGNDAFIKGQKLGTTQKINELGKDLNEEMLSVYESGKKQATKEIGQVYEATPAEDRRLIKLEANEMATKHVQDMRSEMALAARESMRQKQSDAETLAASAAAMKQKAEKQIEVAIGILTSTSINQGIGTVYDRFGDQIWGYQFSAILDGQTTPLCLSLDGRVATKRGELPNPPVHWGCRSRLVAILKSQTEKPDVTGVPKELKSHIGSGFWDASQPKTPMLIKEAEEARQFIRNEIAEREAKIKEYKDEEKYENLVKQHEKRISELKKALK